MEISETKRVPAPPKQTWDALLNPEILKACIPGCQSLEGNYIDGFEAVAVQKVGPIKATFKAVVSISNVVPGESCRIEGHGKGGVAGFAKGHADVQLNSDAEGTLLAYQVDIQIGGKIAQLGSRIIKGFATKLTEQFFEDFQEQVTAG